MLILTVVVLFLTNEMLLHPRTLCSIYPHQLSKLIRGGLSFYFLAVL